MLNKKHLVDSSTCCGRAARVFNAVCADGAGCGSFSHHRRPSSVFPASKPDSTKWFYFYFFDFIIIVIISIFSTTARFIFPFLEFFLG